MSIGTRSILVAVIGLGLATRGLAAVVVAEAETFVPQGDDGWQVLHQDDSYASHTYGGMWVSQGGVLGATAASNGAVAVRTVTIPEAGQYRVWSKYQAPPYFNFTHRIDVVQGGKTVASHVYGRADAERLWSFSAGLHQQLWWFWGVDHDAAEAPAGTVQLAAGPVELRLVSVAGDDPAGDPRIDFVVLTTEPGDTYNGFKPYKVGSPFCLEACAATRLYLRFRNSTDKAARLQVRKPIGHFQPNYAGWKVEVPTEPVAAGAWSPWTEIGSKLTLVHDEGLNLSLPEAAQIELQFALAETGEGVVGDLTIDNGDPVVIPLTITWDPDARVRASRDYAAALGQLARETWRTANGGHKPQDILYYGAFANRDDWAMAFKDAIGYNTLLPDTYAHAPIDGYFQHTSSLEKIKAFAAKLGDAKDRFRVLSFGDEIHIGHINWQDPEYQTQFVTWLQQKGLSEADLGVAAADARLTDQDSKPRIGWYATMFNEEIQFARFRAMTAAARAEIGPQVETGANYSPHVMPQYYGPIYQWIDVFKHNGMSMYWAEDYVFSVAQPPQFISWMFSTVRCAVKYNRQKIHFYIMPHAPGQIPPFLRRGMVFAVGAGANHIDNFWVAPAENFTENYVSWGRTEMFRVLHESIYDSAEAEPFQVGNDVRPARVAIIISKATDHNERLAELDPAKDPFMGRCSNAPSKPKGQRRAEQVTICRRDQQLLYLALKHDQHAVDLITEDDILEGRLQTYQVVYFAGEWIDHRVPPVLQAWIERGGIFYAGAGLGHRNEFDEPDSALAEVLGLKGSTLTRNALVIRPFLELPLTEPIDTIQLGENRIDAIAMRQELVPDSARVLGTWADGKPAVTVRDLGQGAAFAVGTAAGHSYYKTGLRRIPWARGGRKMVYNPTDFAAGATELALLGAHARTIDRDVVCSNRYVESLVIDGAKGTLLTLVNWDNQVLPGLEVTIALPYEPSAVRSVEQQRAPANWHYEDGRLSFVTDLNWADYLLISR